MSIVTSVDANTKHIQNDEFGKQSWATSGSRLVLADLPALSFCNLLFHWHSVSATDS